jgi:hypothetical protein
MLSNISYCFNYLIILFLRRHPLSNFADFLQKCRIFNHICAYDCTNVETIHFGILILEVTFLNWTYAFTPRHWGVVVRTRVERLLSGYIYRGFQLHGEEEMFSSGDACHGYDTTARTK